MERSEDSKVFGHGTASTPFPPVPRLLPKPPARGFLAGFPRKIGYLGLAVCTLGLAAFAILWLHGVDLNFEDERQNAIREFASHHRLTDLRFPGAAHQAVSPPSGISSDFDLSSSALSFVEQEIDADLAQNPGDSRLLFLRAQIHLLRREPGPAIGILERLRPFSPDDPRLLGALGYAHYLRGRAERNVEALLRAIDFFNEALRVEPDDPVLLFNAAVAQQRVGNRKDAKSMYERFLSKRKGDAWEREALSRMRELER